MMDKLIKPIFSSTNFHAKGFVKILKRAGVDKAINTAMDLGLSLAGEPKWNYEKTMKIKNFVLSFCC